MCIDREFIQTFSFIIYLISLILVGGLFYHSPKIRWYILPMVIYLLHSVIFHTVIVFDLMGGLFLTFWSAALRFQEATSFLGVAIYLWKEVYNEDVRLRKHCKNNGRIRRE